MPQITLYRKDGACSMTPHILLCELQIPFTIILMKSGPDGFEAEDGTFSHSDFLNINPAGFVPTLSADGYILTEMPAVLFYIAGLAPERQLTGTTEIERSQVISWLAWLSGTVHAQAIGMLWRPARFYDDSKAFDGIREKGRKVTSQCFDWIETRLVGGFAVGDRFTVVDIFLHTFWRWGVLLGYEMMQAYPKYKEVMRKVEATDSVKAAMAEGQELTFPDVHEHL